MSVATGFEPVAEVTADERAILGLTAAPYGSYPARPAPQSRPACP
jgi:hypothetical protein